MKKNLLFLIVYLVIFTIEINAQVITVSNNTNTPGQYSNLQDAITAANPGDTIYVHGSNTSYGNITVNKRLTFIGPGFNPQSQFALSSYITSITLDTLVPLSSGFGSRFIGLNIGYFVKKTTEFWRIDDILIDRCRIASSLSTHVIGNNWIFRNCYFYWTVNNANLELNYYSNIIITNCIFDFSSIPGTTNSPAIINSNKNSVIINNNLFTGYHQGSSFSNISNAQFSNNIFYGKSPQGASNSIFTNNLTYGMTQYDLPYGNNSGQDNIVNVDPMFTYIPLGVFSFSLIYDYKLLPISPARNMGTDGTDLGIFGGGYPMVLNNNKITGESRLPQIYFMNIQNNVIDQNTPINVNIKARKMN